MGIFTVTLKTHSRKNITSECGELNDCVVHGCKPIIEVMVVGKRKDTHYVAWCKHDDCGKIANSKEDVVKAWNKWNNGEVIQS